jgi:hypothetical protein
MTTQKQATHAFITKMHAIGFALANGFINADDKANKTKREILLNNASKFAGDKEKVALILEGYADAFKQAEYNADTVKQRKSEANAVYKCVALTPITNDHLNQLAGYIGSFNGMIQLARELTANHLAASKPVKDNNVIDIKTKQVRPLTDNQKQQVSDSLKKANANELLSIGENVVNELNRNGFEPVLAEIAQLNLIANIANSMLNNDTFDKATQNVAKEVFKLVNVHVNILEANQKQATQALNDVMAIPALM